MGWDSFTDALERWFADAWSRGLMDAAEDLAWTVSALKAPRFTVSPGLRMLLEAAPQEPVEDEASEVLADHVLVSLAQELRRTVARHGKLQEGSRPYRLRSLQPLGSRSGTYRIKDRFQARHIALQRGSERLEHFSEFEHVESQFSALIFGDI
jgi:hypothetical protein